MIIKLISTLFKIYIDRYKIIIAVHKRKENRNIDHEKYDINIFSIKKSYNVTNITVNVAEIPPLKWTVHHIHMRYSEYV